MEEKSSSLASSIIGFAIAACCTIWAGNRFALANSDVLYGILTSISFGIAFAYGQKIKNKLVPPKPRLSSWKAATMPSPKNPRPARQAGATALTIQFDQDVIKTMRNTIEKERIAWPDIERIDITVSNDTLPTPYWHISSAHHSIRIPNDAPNLEELLEQCKQQLPGYDSDTTDQAIIAAMRMTEGSNMIWRKSNTSRP